MGLGEIATAVEAKVFNREAMTALPQLGDRFRF
jgi:hypothetical protein